MRKTWKATRRPLSERSRHPTTSLFSCLLALLILAGSLFGVQLGALGTTYVKDYMIKVVMAAVMLIVAVSRGAEIPGYLADLDLIPKLNNTLSGGLSTLSFWALVSALGVAGIIITFAMVRGMLKARSQTEQNTAQDLA